LLSTTVFFLSSLFRRNFKRLTRWSSRQGDLRPLHHHLGLNSSRRESPDERSPTSSPTVGLNGWRREEAQ